MRVSGKTIGQWVLPALILFWLCLPASVLAQEAEPEPALPDPILQDELELGKKVYFKRCVWCHGVTGEGDGPSADRLFTRPRNFIQGTFKIRTTDSGELPFDSDLIETVTNGLQGSAMPAWGEFLKKKEIEAVVQFVKTLVQDRSFNDDDEEELFLQDFGDNPWGTKGPHHFGIPKEDIEAGREIFIRSKCFECHGMEGRGEGNSTMKDDWGFPIVAANWRECWNFRGSRRDPYNPFNIVRAVSTGLNGTPMPNFKDSITVEERWKLAAFVNSLCPRKNIDQLTNKPVNDFLIKSKYTAGKVSHDMNDPMWQVSYDDDRIAPRPEGYEGDQYRHYVALAGQITRGNRNFKPKVDNLWVTSRWSDEEQAVYYLVEYDLKFLSTDPKFPDAVAIQWPGKLQELYGAEKPYFIFGDSKKPVDIWKASFLAKDYHPTDPPKDEGYQLDITLEELIGTGYAGLIPKDTENSIEVVSSVFRHGSVKIMFRRSLVTEYDEEETDVRLPVAQYIPVAFMEWSGVNREKDEFMAISTWYYTILEPPVPDSIYYLPPIAALFIAGLQVWLVWMTKRTRKMYAEGKVQ